jgi:hypothetical protein
VDAARAAGGGLLTKRTAEAWLRDVLARAHAGTLPGMVRTGATFAEEAAEWLRYVEQDRGCKPTTLRDYRNSLRAHLLPAFGDLPLEAITSTAIERWEWGIGSGVPALDGRRAERVTAVSSSDAGVGRGCGDPCSVRAAWRRAVNASLCAAVIVLGFAALAELLGALC